MTEPRVHREPAERSLVDDGRPTPVERTVLDAYAGAIKGTLDAALAAASRILIATLALGAGYIALLVQTRPDRTASAILVALPLVGLAIAGVLAMLAIVSGVRPSDAETIEDVRDRLSGAILARGWLTAGAVVSLVVALGFAAVVVAQSPFPAATRSPTPSSAGSPRPSSSAPRPSASAQQTSAPPSSAPSP